MKNKKVIISLTIILSVILFAIIIALILKPQGADNINFDNGKYISKGQFFEKIVKEYSMTSDKYSVDEIQNSKNYNVFADVLVEWEYITKEQAKNPSNPLTRELAAYILVNSVFEHDTYNIKIKDINNCENKQAIIDAVGMGIFELKDEKFNPQNYIKHEEVPTIIENAHSYVANYNHSNSDEQGNDFIDLKITLNNKEYIYPFGKVSDFINNGWEVKDNRDLLNKTIKDIIPNDENTIYVGFNSISLQQDNIVLDITFDTSSVENKVIDSEVIGFNVYQYDKNKTSDIDFYGLNFDSKINENNFKKIFGTKNYSITSDNNEETYYKRLTLNKTYNIIIELNKDIKNNKLLSIGISQN